MSFSSDSAGVSNQILGTINLPEVDNKELFEDRLEELLKRMAEIINTKEGGLYTINEVLAFKQVFKTDDPLSFRNVYRKSFDLVDLNGGNIASGVTVNFPHGITNISDAFLVYVSCVSTAPEYFTAVYSDVYLDATDIYFTNPSGSAVSSAIAVAEYTKE